MPASDATSALLTRTQAVIVGSVPDSLPGSARPNVLIELAGPRAVLDVPGTARYLVEPEGVWAQPVRGATDADVECFLHSSVRALDLLLHRVYSLRAAAVDMGRGAVLITGAPAAGKSVLAAALALRGGTIVADGVAPVDVAPPGPRVWPTDDAVQLWPKAVERLRVAERPHRVVRPALAKRAYRLGGGEAGPVPVALIVEIHRETAADGATVGVLDQGVDKVRLTSGRQWHWPLLRHTDAGLSEFDWLTITSAVPIVRIGRPRGSWPIDELADLVLDHLS